MNMKAILAAVILAVAACGDNQVTVNQCVAVCGANGVCEYEGESMSGPDGVCVCKDANGQCPGDAGK
jgi:hypothetical protein